MENPRLALGMFLIFCCGMYSGGQDRVSNWPRFRGPNGTGISNDKYIPVRWSERDGILWKSRIPGMGNSSPVIWGNRLFVQSSTLDGKERLLLCLDVSDGKALWSRTVPGSSARINPRNTLASSTPATDGRLVYALFWDGAALTLYSYDFNGSLIWKRDLGTHTSQHGAGASPIVYKNKIIVANDQDTSSLLLALNAETGQTVWDVPRPRNVSGTCYSTPFLLERDGNPPELIVATTSGISGYDPETGRESWGWTWAFPERPLRTVGSPIYGQGLIFATSGDGGGARHMVAIEAAAKGGKAAWESKRLPYAPTMLVYGEHLYSVNDRGIAGCHVAKTGENVWTERLGGNITSSPVLIDGRIYCASEEGDVYVFLAAPSFKLLATNSIGETVRATPAVANNRLFIRGQEHLFCIGQSGK